MAKPRQQKPPLKEGNFVVMQGSGQLTQYNGEHRELLDGALAKLDPLKRMRMGQCRLVIRYSTTYLVMRCISVVVMLFAAIVAVIMLWRILQIILPCLPETQTPPQPEISAYSKSHTNGILWTSF